MIYRVAQESLTNVARHADATSATLTLSRQGDGVVLRVADNGRGIGRSAEGPGVLGMRERALLIGADLSIGAQRRAAAPRCGCSCRSRAAGEPVTSAPTRILLADDHTLVRRRGPADPGGPARHGRGRRGRRRGGGGRPRARPTRSISPSSTSPCHG